MRNIDRPLIWMFFSVC